LLMVRYKKRYRWHRNGEKRIRPKNLKHNY